MKDIQSQPDYRNIPIDKVGIKNLRYPVTVRDRRDGFQQTVATINMYVDLPHNNKGTHMSRFVELLHLLRPEVSLKKFSELLLRRGNHRPRSKIRRTARKHEGAPARRLGPPGDDLCLFY